MLLRWISVFLMFFPFLAHAGTVKFDSLIDAADPGIKLFVRSKMAENQTRFSDVSFHSGF